MNLTNSQLKKIISEEIADIINEQTPDAFQFKGTQTHKSSEKGGRDTSTVMVRGRSDKNFPEYEVESTGEDAATARQKRPAGKPAISRDTQALRFKDTVQTPGAEEKLEFVPWEGEHAETEWRGRKGKSTQRNVQFKQAPQTRYGQLDPTRTVSESQLKKIIAEEIQKSKPIQIEFYGPMDPIDFFFAVGFYHWGHPDSKDQTVMKNVYNFMYKYILPGPGTAKRLKSIITDTKSKHPKWFEKTVKRGTQWDIGVYDASTTVRRQRAGGTTRKTTETVEYRWKKK